MDHESHWELMQRVLFLEPYFGGSHQNWFEQLQANSKHHYTPITLPARHWKWRMQASAGIFADQLKHLNPEDYDLILCSEFLSINRLKGELVPAWSQLPFFCYFHENQILYPWSQHDKDSAYERNLFYVFHHLENLKVADYLGFNSHFHFQALLDELPKTLATFPKPRPQFEIEQIKTKSTILPPGIENALGELGPKKSKENPLILWNHRWDADKNPDSFVWLIQKLLDKNFSFQLALLGEVEKSPCWDFFKSLDPGLIRYRGTQSREDYLKVLNQAAILPVTSYHDFFGISTVEAILAGAKVFVPKRMAYSEHFEANEYQHLSYQSDSELLQLVLNFKSKELGHSQQYCQRYLWKNIISKYDQWLESPTLLA